MTIGTNMMLLALLLLGVTGFNRLGVVFDFWIELLIIGLVVAGYIIGFLEWSLENK